MKKFHFIFALCIYITSNATVDVLRGNSIINATENHPTFSIVDKWFELFWKEGIINKISLFYRMKYLVTHWAVGQSRCIKIRHTDYKDVWWYQKSWNCLIWSKNKIKKWHLINVYLGYLGFLAKLYLWWKLIASEGCRVQKNIKNFIFTICGHNLKIWKNSHGLFFCYKSSLIWFG